MTEENKQLQKQEASPLSGTLRNIIAGDYFRQQIEKVLPKHLSPERFCRVALTSMTKIPKLQKCDKASFLNAILALSSFGLEPGGWRAHLIPFENKKRGVVECQLVIGFQGYVELITNTDTVSNIHCDVMCENDEFEYDRGILTRHKIDFKKPRGKPYGAYALIRFKDGSEKCEVIPKDDIYLIRDKSSGWKAFKAGFAKSSPCKFS